MTEIYILIAVLVLLNIWIIRIYLRLGKRLPPIPEDDAGYYDENGNHIYYDRKLIAQLEKEKRKTIQ
jgi:predicted transcriptional regulator